MYKIERLRLNNIYIKNLPWWVRFSFFKASHKKYFLKRKKDLNDFKLLKSFFLNNNHQSEKWKKLKKIDWGLKDRVIKKYITNI